jgi:hypothetical protein
MKEDEGDQGGMSQKRLDNYRKTWSRMTERREPRYGDEEGAYCVVHSDVFRMAFYHIPGSGSIGTLKARYRSVSLPPLFPA